MVKLSKKSVTLRVLAVLPVLMVLYVLQGVVFSRAKLWGVTPLLLPLAACGAGLFGGRVQGCLVGTLAGMLCDLSFHEPTIVFTLLLTFVGLGVGLMADTVLQPGVPAWALTALATLALCGFVQAAEPFFIRGAAAGALLEVGLRQTLVSLPFALPLYFLAKHTGRI